MPGTTPAVRRVRNATDPEPRHARLARRCISRSSTSASGSSACPRPITRLLEEAGFETVGDLLQAEDADLLAIHGIGRAALNRIRERVLHAKPPER